MSQDDNKHVSFMAEEDQFFYQGELENKPLPWDISIKYVLDGNEVEAKDLVGKSGDLDIHIETNKNDKVDPLFFEHYLLQISLTLDSHIFKHIQAPKGTEVNEGKNKQINFTVLPDKEDILITSARVDQLEMDPIQIAAIPAKILIDEPNTDSMTDDLDRLSRAIHDINSGVKSLKDGVNELHDGMTQLKDGSTSFQNGINELDQSSKELVDGSAQFKDGLDEMSRFINIDEYLSEDDLDALNDLPDGLKEIATELKKFADLLRELEKIIDSIPQYNITENELEDVYLTLDDANASEDVYRTVEKLESTYHIAQTLKVIHDQLEDDLSGSVEEFAEHLNLIADKIEQNNDLVTQIDDLKQFIDGLNTFSTQYANFHKGLLDYTDGVHELATSYKEIDKGIADATTGVKDLNSGLNELYDGTSRLQAETRTLPEQMESEIEAFLEDYDFDDFDPISFVSFENEKIGVVQFVLQTEKIEIEKEKDEVEEEENEKGLWELFLNLFK